MGLYLAGHGVLCMPSDNGDLGSNALFSSPVEVRAGAYCATEGIVALTNAVGCIVGAADGCAVCMLNISACNYAICCRISAALVETCYALCVSASAAAALSLSC